MIDHYDSESDFEVERNESGIIITKYTGTNAEVHIPPAIQNLLVTSIGEWAFGGCIRLTAVIIPDNVTSIGEYAFDNCTSLTSVNIGNSVTRIGKNAFRDCAGLTGIIIPKNVTGIGMGAFYTNITSLIISESSTKIGAGAHRDSAGLTSVTFEGTIPLSDFDEDVFFGDLRSKFYETDPTNGTPGTYTTTAPVRVNSVWTRQKENQ